MATQKEVLNIKISVKVEEKKPTPEDQLTAGPLPFNRIDRLDLNREASCTVEITGKEYMVQRLISPLINRGMNDFGPSIVSA